MIINTFYAFSLSGWGRKSVTEGQSIKSEPDKTLQEGGESQKKITNHPKNIHKPHKAICTNKS